MTIKAAEKRTCGGADRVGASALTLVFTLALVACSPVTTSEATSTTPAQATVTPALYTPTPTPTAQPVAAACQPRQLAIQFQTGGVGGGNDFGEILIRNASPAPCSLSGTVDFYGVDAQGQRIAASGMPQPETLKLVVLPPNTPASSVGVGPAAGAYLVMDLLGAYRDDPNEPNALCSAANEVTPSQFVVSVGSVTLRVVNHDPAPGPFQAMEGCHGDIYGSNAALSS